MSDSLRVSRHPTLKNRPQTVSRSHQETSEDEDHWEVIQEQFIHAKLSGLYKDELFREASSDNKTSDYTALTIQIAGLDSDEPILQIGNEIFAGTFEDSPETSVFFRCTEANPHLDQTKEQDPVFSRDLPTTKSTFECKTSKVLRFKRVFLSPKEPTTQDTNNVNKTGDAVTTLNAAATSSSE